jgi:DNA-directed RNA polymerase subunit H (RpoH/RPB5)
MSKDNYEIVSINIDQFGSDINFSQGGSDDKKIKIFQVEKNNEDIRKTILQNSVKMLTERGLLKKENLDKNIKMIIDTQSDDYTYTINLDNPKNKNDTKLIIKIMYQKITSISKQSNISEFLLKYKEMPKIIIVNDITTKALQQIANNYLKTEVFLEEDLMINLVDNVLVPKYEIIDQNNDNFYVDYKCKKRNIPRMLSTDPVAKYYGLKKGDIVRIIRSSETSIVSPFYRLIV